MTAFIQRFAVLRVPAAPEAIAGVFESADFGDFRDETKQRFAAFTAKILEEHQLIAMIAMESFHRPGVSKYMAHVPLVWAGALKVLRSNLHAAGEIDSRRRFDA